MSRPSSFHTKNAFAPATPTNGATPLQFLRRRFNVASVWKNREPSAVSFRSFKTTAVPLYVPSKTSPNDPVPIFFPREMSFSGISTLIAGPSVSACS